MYALDDHGEALGQHSRIGARDHSRRLDQAGVVVPGPSHGAPCRPLEPVGSRQVLGDQFVERFRLECAFADALDGLVSPDVAGRLTAARDAIERTSEDLVAAGRRHGTPTLTATLARRFIEQVARWCVELELATAQLGPADLSVAARRLLARLRVADALGR